MTRNTAIRAACLACGIAVALFGVIIAWSWRSRPDTNDPRGKTRRGVDPADQFCPIGCHPDDREAK